MVKTLRSPCFNKKRIQLEHHHANKEQRKSNELVIVIYTTHREVLMIKFESLTMNSRTQH